jgi:hypothetical protein
MLPLWAFHNAFGISKGLLLGIPRGQNDSLWESTRATFWDSQKEAFGDPKGGCFSFILLFIFIFFFLFLIFIFVFLISHFCQKV